MTKIRAGRRVHGDGVDGASERLLGPLQALVVDASLERGSAGERPRWPTAGAYQVSCARGGA
jgi:hypothetical protein